MENNQNQAQLGQNKTIPNQNQAQVPQPPVTTEFAQSITQQPATPPTPTPQNPIPPKKGHIVKTLLIMIILSIVVVLAILAYLSFANNQSNNTSTIQIENKIIMLTPTPIADNPEEELNAIDAGDVDADLKEVDTDLQTL